MFDPVARLNAALELNAQVIPGRWQKRRMLRPLSGLVVVFALALSSCAVHAQLTEHQPKILFDGGESPYDKQIYVMDSDGSNVQRLTEGGWAAWSPDRQKIAFMSNRDGDPGDPEIYVMDADGSDVQQLTRHKGFDGSPHWSPDGNQIFSRHGPTGNRPCTPAP